MRYLAAWTLCALLGACSSNPVDADSGNGGNGGNGGAASGGAVGSGGTTGSGTTGSGASPAAGGLGGLGSFALPPLDASLDYQLGGAYEPPDGVSILSRDRTVAPAVGLYNICYVNGFQIQPGEEGFWIEQHPDLVLRNESNEPIIDADWNEVLIDVGTDAKREAVAAIIGQWIVGCANDGFDAVEIDNLDSFSRSQDLLEEDDAVATVRAFADVAHAHGLAIAQKNSAELVGRKAEMDTDFVVAEECNTWGECDVYMEAYGQHVLVIEYVADDFTTGCAAFPELSIVLRDRDLVGPSSPNYVYDGC